MRVPQVLLPSIAAFAVFTLSGDAPAFAGSKRVKAAHPVAVLLNTGAKAGNVGAFLPLVDGVIVGSDLKADGHTWNPVERERVRRFLAAVGDAR